MEDDSIDMEHLVTLVPSGDATAYAAFSFAAASRSAFLKLWPGRYCSPRHPTHLNPRFLPGRYCSPRHPTHLNPRFLRYKVSYDVASNICQALPT